MSAILFSQIAVDVDKVLATYRFMDPSTLGGLLVFGAIGLVTLLALIWAIFLRKRRRRRHSHHHAHRHESPPTETPAAPNDEDATAPPQKRRKWRRSHRKHHQRNPTLAETGGLPPVRPDSPPETQP